MEADRLEGQRRRDEGIRRVSRSDPDFLRRARQVAEFEAWEDRNHQIWADDLHELLDQLGIAPMEDVSPNIWGGIFAERSKWKKIVSRPSQYPASRQGGNVSLWRLRSDYEPELD
jgi:hypothetical protein